MRLKTLDFLLRHEADSFCNDNLHLIAISNLNDGERTLQRWWERKYSSPLTAFDDHTIEELIVKNLEDFYDANPAEIQKFLTAYNKENEWDGRMSAEHEARMKKRLAKNKQIDLTKYQDSRQTTEEEDARILDSLGRNLPGSKFVRDFGDGNSGVKHIGAGEFDEDFSTPALGGG